MAKATDAVSVFTDGACSGNPGPGGWGWVTEDGREGSGGEAQTTNQRMELQAVLEALRTLDGRVSVTSDSTYVVNCFRDKWYEGWLARGWRNASKKPVANRDLWEPLIELYLERADDIEFHWIKGHSGHPLNERADELAVEAATAVKEEAVQAEKLSLRQAYSNVDPAWPADRAVWVVGATSLDDDERDRARTVVGGLDPKNDILISGLRRGAELETAERALARGIPLAVVLPFNDPAEAWGADEKARFDSAQGRAQWKVVLPGDRARPGAAIEARNAWIEQHVVGALVLGDAELAATLDEAGLPVL